MSKSPTQRTLEYLRECGHVADVVERYNAHTRRRHDWLGFVDIISVCQSGGRIHFWQATSGDNMAARVKKIREHENFRHVAEAGPVWVIGWRKYAKAEDGKYWRPRIERVSSDD